MLHYQGLFDLAFPDRRDRLRRTLLRPPHPDRNPGADPQTLSDNLMRFHAVEAAFARVAASPATPQPERPRLAPAPGVRRGMALLQTIERDLGQQPSPALRDVVAATAQSAAARALIWRALERGAPQGALTAPLVRALARLPTPAADVTLDALTAGVTQDVALNALACAREDAALLRALFAHAASALDQPLGLREARLARRVFTAFDRAPTAALLALIRAARGLGAQGGAVIYHACAEAVPDAALSLPAVQALLPVCARFDADAAFRTRVMALLRAKGAEIGDYAAFDFRGDQHAAAEAAGMEAAESARVAGAQSVASRREEAETGLLAHAKERLTPRQRDTLAKTDPKKRAHAESELAKHASAERNEYLAKYGDFGEGAIEATAQDARRAAFNNLRDFFASPAVGNDPDAADILSYVGGERPKATTLVSACRAAPGLRLVVAGRRLPAATLLSALTVFGGAAPCAAAIAALGEPTLQAFALHQQLPGLLVLHQKPVPVLRIGAVAGAVQLHTPLLSPAVAPHLATLLTAMDLAPCVQLLDACASTFAGTRASCAPLLATIHAAAPHGVLLTFLQWLKGRGLGAATVSPALAGAVGLAPPALKQAVFAQRDVEIGNLGIDRRKVADAVFLRWMQLVSLRLIEGDYTLALINDWAQLEELPGVEPTDEIELAVMNGAAEVARLVVHHHPFVSKKDPNGSRLHAKPRRGDKTTPHAYATDSSYAGFWSAFAPFKR